ncbi:MAG: LuxR C-terminal-related transcriptional regulator [Gemmobacter sp.]
MPEPASDSGSDDEAALRARIVERLYDVAVDPVRLEDLVELWEDRFGRLRQDAAHGVVPMEDSELLAHAGRAAVFLERHDNLPPEDRRIPALDEISRSAAFVADGSGAITACNRAAEIAFGISAGGQVRQLPFDGDDCRTLTACLRRVVAGRPEGSGMLRLRSTRSGGPVILRVTPVTGPERTRLALVVSTELVWPEGFEATVRDAFDLTAAEVEIVRGIAIGLPMREIAAVRGRSPETVRTQMRSILAKTETHSQAELVRVVLGLMDLAQPHAADGDRPPTAPPGALGDLPFDSVVTPDGRRLTWIEFGDPEGAPCLFMPIDFAMSRWPAPAEHAAADRGIRVIVPLRQGYGPTDLLPRGLDHLTGCTMDYAAVLDALGVRDAAVIALGSDIRYAMNLANLRPDLVSGIIGCAAQLPIQSAAQYERMDKWQRFIQANARYAPKVLPFLVRAGFSFARKLGKERFFRVAYGNSRADMKAFDRPEIRDAVLRGTEVMLGRDFNAVEAFAAECLDAERDWSGVVRACRVPVLLMQGDEDVQTPLQTVREQMQDYPHLQFRFLPGNGMLLFFAEWPQVLDELERFLRR